LEREHVHAFYDDIAEHFSHTRHSAWPRVEAFVRGLPPHTFMADVGCGNGKYMGFVKHCLGSDRSAKLCQITAARGFEVGVADALCLPYRDSAFDVVICIALLHHLSSVANRLRVLQELIRIVRPGGQVLVTGWALEQGTDSRRKFETQDTFVSWHLHAKFVAPPPHAPSSVAELSSSSAPSAQPSTSTSASVAATIANTANAPTSSSANLSEAAAAVLHSPSFTIDPTKGTVVLQRYCHVYVYLSRA
jgi:SAM-dependent methyltransferase